jgi:hypothetical protein
MIKKRRLISLRTQSYLPRDTVATGFLVSPKGVDTRVLVLFEAFRIRESTQARLSVAELR